MSHSSNEIHGDHFPDHLLAVNQQATDENVALFHAAEKGLSADVLACIKRGGKPNFFFRKEDEKNALHVAAEKGFVDVISTLLNHGAVVDCRCVVNQNTALIFAAHHENVVIIRTLIQHGADVNAQNGYGNTALHEACHEGHITIARELIEGGANVNARNHKGSTALHTLCYNSNPRPHSLELLKLLVHSGADVHARDLRGMTPLLVCCTSGRLDFIQFLVECGADPTVRDVDKQDARDIAIFYQRDAVADRFQDDSPFRRHAEGGWGQGEEKRGEGKASHK